MLEETWVKETAGQEFLLTTINIIHICVEHLHLLLICSVRL